jgi:N-acetylglucosaminylphosphatidylinositol deacetylase
LGQIREAELHRVGRELAVHRAIVVNEPRLPDSPVTPWSRQDIGQVLERELLLPSSSSSMTLYTFDARGVSGHPNHMDTHAGVLQFCSRHSHIQAYELVTVTNVISKYLPLLHWIRLLLVVLFSWHPPSHSQYYYTWYQPWVNWKCMTLHASQFVWYRRLFVIFSCYTYENQWKPILPNSSNRKEDKMD